MIESKSSVSALEFVGSGAVWSEFKVSVVGVSVSGGLGSCIVGKERERERERDRERSSSE